MNEDLSSIIEHALMYASPLPVTTAAGNLETSGERDVSCISHGEHSPYSSTFPTFSQLNNVQAFETVPTNNVAADNLNSQNKLAESVIEKYIEDTLQFSAAEDISDTIQDLDSEYSSVNDNSLSVLTNQPQSQSMTTSDSVLPVQTDTCITHDSLPNRPDVTVLPPEAYKDNESVQERSSSPSIDLSASGDTQKQKKKRNREKNPGPRPEPHLPSCSICNEKSTGFHYGANTCEACKAFFRRTQKKQKIRFKCKCKPEEREDWKRGPIKNGCAACRYERCLMVGMSKNAIKIGRYTLNHKTKNINEIKLVESTESLPDNAVSPVPESSPSSSSGLEACFSSPENAHIGQCSPASKERHEVNQSPSITSRNTYNGRQSSAQTSQNSVISLKEIDSIVKALTEAQTRIPFDDTVRVPLEIIRQKQTEYLEKYKLKTELFGDMGLSKEEFTEFYNITGIDLDGRMEHIDDAFQFFEKKISFVVAFAKSIPGFKSLKLDDQANLLKASRTESTLLNGYKSLLRNFDMERRIVTTPWGKEIHMDELARLIPMEFLFMKLRCARQIRDLDLTVQEESIVRGIVTMFSDRCILEEPHTVEQIQEKLVACLQHLLSVRPGGPGTLLYRIFNLITNLRDFTENENDFTRKMLIEWPMISTNKYHLLKEFLT